LEFLTDQQFYRVVLNGGHTLVDITGEVQEYSFFLTFLSFFFFLKILPLILFFATQTAFLHESLFLNVRNALF